MIHIFCGLAYSNSMVIVAQRNASTREEVASDSSQSGVTFGVQFDFYPGRAATLAAELATTTSKMMARSLRYVARVLDRGWLDSELTGTLRIC
jgi:hypothetical protein